jgi:hypothetical protein
MKRHFLERVNAQNLQSSTQLEFLVEDGHHDVDGHRDPDLRLHRIGAVAIEVLGVWGATERCMQLRDIACAGGHR